MTESEGTPQTIAASADSGFHLTKCAICDTVGNATELYESTMTEDHLNPVIFSARRLPDRIHYRMVKCNTCGLIRSDPVADSSTLAHLYFDSQFDYDDEADNIAQSYLRYLKKVGMSGRLLEVGCGNGFFLEYAETAGYTSIHGVEPSLDAIEKASPKIQPLIVNDIVRTGLFEPGSFDVICMFQVLDHLPDPGTVLEECFALLKPGGAILSLNHDVNALSSKLLGERSPIVDVEHTYLYSKTTMRKLFEKYGFQIRQVGSASNTYTLHYLTRLLPVPKGIKNRMLDFLAKSPVGRIKLTVRLGNLYLIGIKPV